ncbi:GGDEF domain-containing protein [Agarivorans sp. TSD2052]|uniref:GGDEF domain-containing protein n=1 Tax=Agarivorans sp. TSD2052 TaxID=2937286 RepID=UPI0020109D6F|nr:GGDEF domain-containing protein [Agarivorans sp. TSD2052]UPW18595.1 GGDEF domain-containing protein [Agarivorans sp. TSD2052]
MKQQANYLSWLRNLLIFGTLLVLCITPWLPTKKLVLYPRSDMLIDLFADRNSGGNSFAYWLTGKKAFACDLAESSAPVRYCGVSIKYHSLANDQPGDPYTHLRNIDLSDYYQINVDIEYQGPNDELRFFMRGSDSTSGKNLSNAKFMFTYFKDQELGQAASAQLNQFSIPAWWLDKFYQSREDFRLDFSNIKEISFDIPSNASDALYKITLNKIEAEGQWVSKQTLYGSIIAVWSCYFMAVLARYIYQQKRRLTQSIRTLEHDVDELKVTATIDQLTGVFNRRGLLDKLEEKPLTEDNHYLFVFDIDHFKLINDSYGHNNGDEVLRFFARQLSSAIRGQDLFARWGGEEFILLSQHQHEVDAFSFAERLRELIYQQDFLLSSKGKQQHIKLSMSVGLTKIDKEEAFNTAFNRADHALYQAKDSGRNRSKLAG